MNSIEIKDLCKSYGDFSLNHINLTLPAGSIMGLVGENGAGKTTTLRLIMNAVLRDSGSVKVLGVNTDSHEFDSVKEDVGVVLDEAYFPEVINARNVSGIMMNTYRNWDEAQYDKYIRRFALPPEKQFKEYSRGMKMKFAIAVALSHHPRLLILDEATSGLDPIVRDEILDLFNDFTREEDHSILLSSHIVSDLEKICDYIAFLHQGNLLFCEEKDRLLEEYAIVRMSRGDFERIPREAVKGRKQTPYGVEALVRKDCVPISLAVEHTSIEDIILFLAKGEKKA